VQIGETGNERDRELVHAVFREYHWIIDHGHGLNAPEHKRSPSFEDGTFVYEGDINRRISKKLFEKLEENGIAFTNLVPTDDDVSLRERLERIDALQTDRPKILVSIHSNFSGAGNPWSAAEGIEVFHDRYNETSKNLANVFIGKIIRETRARQRSTKSLNLAIFKTSTPSILVECGFLDNKKELDSLQSPTYQDKIVKGMVEAIKKINADGI